MILTSVVYGRVLSGRKTQMRRLVDNFDPGYVTNKRKKGASRSLRVPFQPVAGDRFPVSRKGETDPAHVILTDVRRGQLGTITFEDARAEGHKTTDDFKLDWVRRHDTGWLPARDPETEPDVLLCRFDARWSTREVWVLTFELDTDENARLLADRNAREDYVTSPSRALSGSADPGEAVDARTQDKFSREGHQGFVAREKQREIDREHMAAEERLRQVRIDARAAGVEIGHLEAAIIRTLRAAERKIHQRKQAA